jgi:hypothetical protein
MLLARQRQRPGVDRKRIRGPIPPTACWRSCDCRLLRDAARAGRTIANGCSADIGRKSKRMHRHSSDSSPASGSQSQDVGRIHAVDGRGP